MVYLPLLNLDCFLDSWLADQLVEDRKMNLTKFLLIDGILIVFAIPLLLIYQWRKYKQPLFNAFNSNITQSQVSITTPSIEELLRLEGLAQKSGSGIEFDSLIGIWRFLYVWQQETDDENTLASSLLRLFSANLELRSNQEDQECVKFDIINSIQFGALQIRFVGLGDLTGRRPLLLFYFERIELKLGGRLLLSRTLDIPDEKQRPFFSLIGMESTGRWLAARGKGGGLALWLKS